MINSSREASSKLVLVTGAAGGMGSATVRRLVRDGHRVAALDISADRLEALGREFNGAVPTFRCDQTDEAAVRGTVEQIIAQVGPVDILVNTTGWAGTTRFEEEDSRYWRKIIAINLESALYVTSALLPHMIERKSGK